MALNTVSPNNKNNVVRTRNGNNTTNAKVIINVINITTDSNHNLSTSPYIYIILTNEMEVKRFLIFF